MSSLTLQDPKSVSSDDAKLAAYLMVKLFVRPTVIRIAEVISVSYCGQHPVDTALINLERTYQESKAYYKTMPVFFVDGTGFAQEYCDLGMCTSFEGKPGKYQWKREFLDNLLSQDSLKQYLGDWGWIQLLVLLFFQYQKSVFIQTKFDQDTINNEEAAQRLEEGKNLYISTYCRRLQTDAQRIMTGKDMVAFVQSMIESGMPEPCTAAHRVLTMLLVRALGGEDVPLQVRWLVEPPGQRPKKKGRLDD